jgi:hypothetical protein
VRSVPDDDEQGNRIAVVFGPVTVFVKRDDAVKLADAIRREANTITMPA